VDRTGFGHESLVFLFRYAHKNLSVLDPASRTTFGRLRTLRLSNPVRPYKTIVAEYFRTGLLYFVDYVRVQWNQIIEELRQWQQLQVDAKLALAA